MPTIARFGGMTCTMYYADHLPPHFHVRYGSHVAVIRIDPAMIDEGSLPRPAERQVLDWTRKRQGALLDNWERAQRHEPLKEIRP